jgi:hypothetical protein
VSRQWKRQGAIVSDTPRTDAIIDDDRPLWRKLTDFVELCGKLERELAAALADARRLQVIIDSRPAINAGLPETYIEWSRGIYLTDYAKARGYDDAAIRERARK